MVHEVLERHGRFGRAEPVHEERGPCEAALEHVEIAPERFLASQHHCSNVLERAVGGAGEELPEDRRSGMEDRDALVDDPFQRPIPAVIEQVSTGTSVAPFRSAPKMSMTAPSKPYDDNSESRSPW